MSMMLTGIVPNAIGSAITAGQRPRLLRLSFSERH
jgi:hypothetical protein